ncbi:MAG: hypothetical protein ACTSO9_11970 [Candidatus Helarchaeota archaeon]
MLNERTFENLGLNQENNLNTYQQRIGELKKSQYFWNNDRIVKPNMFRIIFLGIAALIISLGTWYICNLLVMDEFLSVLISIIIFACMTILVQPQIYNRIFYNFSKLPNSTLFEIDIMDKMRCFFYKDVSGALNEDVLFVENNGQLTAFGMYKIDTIPIGISGEFKHFIRSIYGQKIPIFWNYIQAPVTEKEVIKLKNVSLDTRLQLARSREDDRNNFILNMDGIWEARIVFGTSATKKIGMNITNTIQEIYNQISENLMKLKSSFLISFPHSKIVLLKGKDIISAIRAQLTNGGHFRFF